MGVMKTFVAAVCTAAVVLGVGVATNAFTKPTPANSTGTVPDNWGKVMTELTGTVPDTPAEESVELTGVDLGPPNTPEERQQQRELEEHLKKEMVRAGR